MLHAFLTNIVSIYSLQPEKMSDLHSVYERKETYFVGRDLSTENSGSRQIPPRGVWFSDTVSKHRQGVTYTRNGGHTRQANSCGQTYWKMVNSHVFLSFSHHARLCQVRHGHALERSVTRIIERRITRHQEVQLISGRSAMHAARVRYVLTRGNGTRLRPSFRRSL